MPFKAPTPCLSASPQLSEADVVQAERDGFRAIVNNRPDGEEPGQASAADMQALAARHGMEFAHIPAILSKIGDAEVAQMANALMRVRGPVLAYCRTGTRSATLWALSRVGARSADEIIATAADAGNDLAALRPQLEKGETLPEEARPERTDIVIVGGGSASLATAASLFERDRTLNIVVIEPHDTHDYQPGWTMVGGVVFDVGETRRSEASVVPLGVRWIKGAIASFAPEQNSVMLEDGSSIGYRALVVAPGIALDCAAMDGLPETLGKNGVTSNYSFDAAPYTWELVQSLKGGTALFTQPQRMSWLLKSEALPWVYWNAMLKGREWMAHPQHRDAA